MTCVAYEPLVKQEALWNDPLIYMMAEFQVVPRGWTYLLFDKGAKEDNRCFSSIL